MLGHQVGRDRVALVVELALDREHDDVGELATAANRALVAEIALDQEYDVGERALAERRVGSLRRWIAHTKSTSTIRRCLLSRAPRCVGALATWRTSTKDAADCAAAEPCTL